MTVIRLAATAVSFILAATLAIAGAREDLRIEKKVDADRNTIYVLTNTGSRTIEAKVEVKKDCTGNRRKPQVRTFWVNAGASRKIAKAWSETSCRHSYRVIEAKYH